MRLWTGAGRKTSFAYKLEIPQELGEVQQELQIKKEASYTLSMKACYILYHLGSAPLVVLFVLACHATRLGWPHVRFTDTPAGLHLLINHSSVSNQHKHKSLQ